MLPYSKRPEVRAPGVEEYLANRLRLPTMLLCCSSVTPFFIISIYSISKSVKGTGFASGGMCMAVAAGCRGQGRRG